jgi:hypothetical protein
MDALRADTPEVALLCLKYLGAVLIKLNSLQVGSGGCCLVRVVVVWLHP